MSKRFISILFLTISFYNCQQLASAENIYKWVDSSGNVHYSSKPLVSHAEVAKLPPIMHGEVKIPVSQRVSCQSHGGVDCQAGADTDGSVVCRDGFRESVQRFRFSCSAAKLEISQISDRPDKDGSFIVFVRNSKGVAALEPSMLVKLPDGSKTVIAGPKEIEGFGVAEFKFPASPKGKSGQQSLSMAMKPSLENIDLLCRNCPG